MTTGPVAPASAEDRTTIFYPESDGMPLPDGEFQSPLFREIVSTLAAHLDDRPNTNVNGNTFIYYEEGNPRRFVSPDCYVAFDISLEPIERFNAYLIWEVGKSPDFVLEIGSPSTASTDRVEKRELYARLGIAEYWRYDATGGDFYGEPLVGEYLAEGEYRRIEMNREADGMVWAHSPLLNLDLCWDEGRLRFYDPAARVWLLNQMEERAARESAEARVEAEQAARESAEARLATLEDELRQLRG